MKILAVDDDAVILELIPMIAAAAGFPDVTVVSSGKLALAAIESSDTVFDCLLLDIQMPEMDGIELCRRVRVIPAYRRTPIIMLTAMREKDFVDRAFRAGASDYATKPFDITELGARLRMAQELVRARQEILTAKTMSQGDRAPAMRSPVSDLSEPISIEGFDAIVDYPALGNYLAQLSRAGQSGSQVLAVKMDQIAAIHERASRAEFLHALCEVAKAVLQVININGGLMAYAGNGVFVIISHTPDMVSSIEYEAEIQSLLADRPLQFDNGDVLDIVISLGNPIRPSFSKTQGVRRTFDRAIGRAEKRALRRQDDQRPLRVGLSGAG